MFPMSRRLGEATAVTRRAAAGCRAGLAALLILAALPLADAQIRDEPYVHLGVSTCGSGPCHGRFDPAPTGNVALNEYTIWQNRRLDPHSGAYASLDSEQGRAIAAKLGLASPLTAQECLDCHADNVAPERRGPEFQLTDGVSCEACHGGAEPWVDSHAEMGATHRDNLAKGMYATESPLSRAEICVSCHVGTSSQLATHAMMAAGHPRLTFELETSTANQNPHFVVDDDYRARKGNIESFNLWISGQLVAASRNLQLVKSHLYAGNGVFPELALFDCDACHHGIDDLRWSRVNVGPDIAPGTPRLQKQHLLMVEAATMVLEPAAAAELKRTIEAFAASGDRGEAAVTAAADRLLAWIDARKEAWATRVYERAQIQAVRKQLIAMAVAGRLADFASAEQAVLSIQGFTLSLGQTPAQRAALDRLFDAALPDTYRPGAFRATADRDDVEGVF